MKSKAEKTEWLHLRISPAEAAELQEAAKARSVRVSTLAREAIKSGLKTPAAPAIGGK